MMTRWLALVLILLPCAVTAQVSTVRSGDHRDFSRLTVALPPGTDWSMQQEMGRLRISFSGDMERPDLSQIFRRISRDRIEDVQPLPGNGLDIRLTCDCPTVARLSADNLLIIDVGDGPPLPDLPPSISADAAPTASDRPLGPEMTEPAASSLMPVQDLVTATPQDHSHAKNAEKFALRRVTTLPDVPAPVETNPDLTNELETSLLQAIGRAATEGLLDADAANAALIPKDLRQVSGTHDSAPHAAPGIMATPGTLDAAKPGENSRFMLSGDTCEQQMPATIDAATEADFSTRLGALRTGLTAEFDRDNVTGYQDLARFYLLHGFGAEALRLLESVPQNPALTAEMISVANILEYGHDASDGPFAGKIACDTEAAMWAALTGATLAPGQDFNGSAILRAVTALPVPLKSYLGPVLAERFSAAQENELAKDLLRIVDRDVSEPTAMRNFAAARITTQEEGQPDHAAYQDLIAQNDSVSPEALLHYATESLDNGGSIDPETIGLLESYRTQYRDDPISGKLVRTEIIAHASAGNFPAAYDLFASQSALLDDATRATVADGLTRNLASHAADAVFTRQFFGHEAIIREGARAETMNAVAQRLLDLGFLEQAEQLIAIGADGEAGRQRRVLRAKIALASNLPRRAEAELFGLTGEDIDLLRAQASLDTSDYEQAQNLFNAAGDTQEAGTAAWLARDWGTVKTLENTQKARLADLVTQQQAAPITLPVVGPPTLAVSRDVLSQSTDTRNALRELLSTVQVETALDQ
ncbi:hypothetical protein [Pseudooceanicola spongiae]|uniref:Uncharacterized protein n=1 Tax=Pseudooceanicola spongiae TaxID=2613965 RepID=A0A7L9WNR0_9RHOB|nr:hypothetical protein [Pseudooceanicola spongiae]QOL81879.1 hypothetical protein F3W81_14240 [Pseudooceanicola spongiae]